MASTKSPRQAEWLASVERHDYAAAKSYLSLIYPTRRTARLVRELRAAKLTSFKAKDIFRASRLTLLGVSNSHVARDGAKIQQGVALSPLLLVRDTPNGTLVIADGYHRLCAVYRINEDAVIPCKIV